MGGRPGTKRVPGPPAPHPTTLSPSPPAPRAQKSVIPKDRLGFFHLNVCLICSVLPCDHDVTFGLVGISITGEAPGSLEGTCGLEIAKRSKSTTKGEKKTSRAFFDERVMRQTWRSGAQGRPGAEENRETGCGMREFSLASPPQLMIFLPVAKTDTPGSKKSLISSS